MIWQSWTREGALLRRRLEIVKKSNKSIDLRRDDSDFWEPGGPYRSQVACLGANNLCRTFIRVLMPLRLGI